MARQSIEQRDAALQEANRRRTIRAGLKREANADPMLRPIIDVLEGTAPALDAVEGIRVGELLLAGQGIGAVKVRRMLREAGIARPATTRVRELGPVQRGALAAVLRRFASDRARRLGFREEEAA